MTVYSTHNFPVLRMTPFSRCLTTHIYFIYFGEWEQHLSYTLISNSVNLSRLRAGVTSRDLHVKCQINNATNHVLIVSLAFGLRDKGYYVVLEFVDLSVLVLSVGTSYARFILYDCIHVERHMICTCQHSSFFNRAEPHIFPSQTALRRSYERAVAHCETGAMTKI